MEKWSIVKVLCTDGVIRMGMLQEGIYGDIDETSAIDGLHGLHIQYAEACLPLAAEKYNLDQFDNCGEYDEEEIIK